MKRLLYLLALLIVGNAYAQQYTVVGGTGTPLLADDNSNYRVQVYLVYGMQNARISYTSSSTAHKWYKYTTGVDELNHIPVASTQDGTTSYITDIEDGHGYYVDENGAMRRYVWIIDYSRYSFEIQSLETDPDVDACVAFRLRSNDALMPDMFYRTPGGASVILQREFEVVYSTMEWNSSLSSFAKVTHTETFSGDPFARSFTKTPLCDTEITLRGDMFARHFGVEQSATVPFYEAKAIEVYADTLILSAGTSNAGGSDTELSAPALIRFRAYANTPVASLFNWKISNAEEPDKPLINFTGEEVEYTFDRYGNYTATLEVSDRSGSCYNDEYSFDIGVTETVMEIPNAFSPGVSPGINDIFRVKYQSVVRFQGWIYNRWGNELFHWSDPSQGWDGKYRGKYVPAGAYYYLIEYIGADGKKRVRKGDVNVFRSSRINMDAPAEQTLP